MHIDLSNLLLATMLHAAALIVGAILLAYLANIVPVTFSAWFVEALDSKKIAALLASSVFILLELILLFSYLSGVI